MAEVQAAAAGPVEEAGGDGEGGAQGAVDLERERVEHRVGAVVIDQGVALRVEDRDEGGVEGAVVIGGAQVDGDPGGVGVGEGDGVGGVLAVDAGKPGGGGVAVAVGLGEGGLGPVEFEGPGVGDVGGGGWNGGPGVEVVGVRCCPVRTVDLDVMSITFTVCVGCVEVVVDGGGEESGAGVGEVGGGDAGARGGDAQQQDRLVVWGEGLSVQGKGGAVVAGGEQRFGDVGHGRSLGSGRSGERLGSWAPKPLLSISRLARVATVGAPVVSESPRVVFTDCNRLPFFARGCGCGWLFMVRVL
ncbi:hypothetical protein Francci3_3336 [Frankia casuarinae]|uniref:Uncharacterized protein n=1 Tax=Frankia casuarinae (strain DSM 45818 / CECT 9043 / HFP020203 / CcI3) TaxID=106370 RepID=Q2J7P9_FRACC|nr:hypothetical protein Francci3_3336 [Frankia casuarinae]